MIGFTCIRCDGLGCEDCEPGVTARRESKRKDLARRILDVVLVETDARPTVDVGDALQRIEELLEEAIPGRKKAPPA